MKSLFENGKCTKSTNGVSYLGVRIKASYNELVTILGTPHSTNDDKEFNTWFYENKRGDACRIYDPNFRICPSQYPDEKVFWHIGGFDWMDCMYMQEDIEEALSKHRKKNLLN